MSNALDRIASYNGYELGVLTGNYPTDTNHSPGATWYSGIRDGVLERAQWAADHGEPIDEDTAHEIADAAVPVYTGDRWQVFTELEAWTEDVSELGYVSADDMTEAAGVALYMIAYRLVSALIEDLVSPADG